MGQISAYYSDGFPMNDFEIEIKSDIENWIIDFNWFINQ